MIRLDYRDARPIYEQIRDSLRHLVVAGALQPGDQLPSVRALASSLAINPNTIQRAYEALEREGYVHAVAGKGRFAAPREQVARARQEHLLEDFDRTAAELVFLGVSPAELTARLGRPSGEEGEP